MSEKLDQKQAVGLLKKKTLETNRLCELEMAELEGQRQDVLFSLKAQQEVRRSLVACVVLSDDHNICLGRRDVEGLAVENDGSFDSYSRCPRCMLR